MSSATARFFSLLSTSLPLRHLHRYRSSLLFLSRSPPPRSFPHLSRRFHFNAYSQISTNDQFNDYVSSSTSTNGAGAFSPWPEWNKLINSFQFSRYSGRIHGIGKFVDDGTSLPGDFVRSATACLEFAREHESLLWSLSRKDVEIVVENGTPFLFKDAADTMSRMKLFLYGSTDQVFGSDKPSTIDVMKFLLSYASTALASSEKCRFNNMEIVEASVRRLFNQLAEISGASESSIPGSFPSQYPGANVQPPNSSEQHIQMKRGDWICPRCSFMNFARNMKCLECEEARPKRQITEGEWECPQCDFFNYGRNSVCLRCDCKKPGMSNPLAGSSYNNNCANNESSHKQSGQNQGRVQNWFHKISQLENMSNEDNASTDNSVIQNFPFKEGVISETNTLHQGGNESPDFKISQRFDKILQQSTDSSGASGYASPFSNEFPEKMPIRKGENRFVVREKEDRSLTSPLYKRHMAMEQSKSNNYVPFVPFPPNYFAKDQNQPKEESPAGNSYTFDQSKAEPVLNQKSNYNAPMSQPAEDQKTSGLWRGSSLEGSAVKEPDPLDMSEEAKAERWFKRVAQIKDIKELSEIPDEDFPSIMPMRKGVNRFVVSKRKTPLERRLASSQYRRNLPVVKSDPLKDDENNDN